MSKQKLISRYADLYRKLYDREPRGLKQINGDFVAVNGMQMRFADLEVLTRQLEKEYQATHQKKRSNILKLIDWFRS